jgi:hypothetical protein
MSNEVHAVKATEYGAERVLVCEPPYNWIRIERPDGRPDSLGAATARSLDRGVLRLAHRRFEIYPTDVPAARRLLAAMDGAPKQVQDIVAVEVIYQRQRRELRYYRDTNFVDVIDGPLALLTYKLRGPASLTDLELSLPPHTFELPPEMAESARQLVETVEASQPELAAAALKPQRVLPTPEGLHGHAKPVGYPARPLPSSTGFLTLLPAIAGVALGWWSGDRYPEGRFTTFGVVERFNWLWFSLFTFAGCCTTLVVFVAQEAIERLDRLREAQERR